jgi:hypothetical protein
VTLDIETCALVSGLGVLGVVKLTSVIRLESKL